METTMETPIQMTTGVVQSIGTQPTNPGIETGMGFGDEKGVTERVFEEQSGHSEFISESQEIPDQVRDDNKSVSNSSDLLLQSAKEDGFEEALVRLSNGEFSEEEFEDAEDEEVLEIPKDKIPEEEIPLSEQISLLEDKILGLEDINRQLTERITNLEIKDQVLAEDLLKLLLMLQKLVEEEKDKDEETGLLEILINFFIFFMMETFVPKDEKEKTQTMEKVEPKKKAKISSEELLEILRMLKKEGTPKPSQTPHIEKMAA